MVTRVCVISYPVVLLVFNIALCSRHVSAILKTDMSGNVAYWIGGNDLDIEQGWQWSDGSPFNYFSFSAGNI